MGEDIFVGGFEFPERALNFKEDLFVEEDVVEVAVDEEVVGREGLFPFDEVGDQLGVLIVLEGEVGGVFGADGLERVGGGGGG